jgi:hypothetical protein
MSKNIEELLNRAESWEAALQEDGFVNEDTRVTIKEAFATPDAAILFPKVISRTLKEAAEPEFLVTPLLSTVRLQKGRSLEFPAVNALQAAEIPEGQEYPEQALVFAKQIEGKVSKKGVKVAFTEEVVTDSLWDIVGLHVRAAGRAMARLKEQIALQRFKDAATIVFDNDSGSYDDTTGLGAAGTANLTLAWEDVIEMAAVLHAENHVPTDFILHPLMWSIFLRSAPFHAPLGAPPLGWNQSLGSKSGVLGSTAPFGLNVILSPFVSFTAKAGATPAKSDVFLLDRNEVGTLLVKDDMSVDDWNDQTRDIRYMKMKERYDIIAMGDGEGITVAKNVRLSASHDIQLTKAVA